jgi:hypothetical protein
MKIRLVYQNYKYNGEDLSLTPFIGWLHSAEFKTYGLSINWIY